MLAASEELFKVVPEVTIIHLALTLVSAFIVAFGLFSGFVKEKLYVGEAIIATVAGIIFSQYVGGVFAPTTWAGREPIISLYLLPTYHRECDSTCLDNGDAG